MFEKINKNINCTIFESYEFKLELKLVIRLFEYKTPPNWFA